MLRTCIDEQVVDELVTKTSLRKHTFNGLPYEFSRSAALKNLLRRGKTLSTRISGVTSVNLVGHLLTLEGNLLSIDDDDIVTAINMRRVASFGLATKDKSNACCKTAKCQIGSINDDPLFVYSILIQEN